MANIKIMVDGALMDGHRVTFKAPCDCVTVEKLKICYVKDGEQKSRLFTMKDSHGNDLTGLGNLFSEDAYVDAILDTNNGVAYLQNAATNGYLEQKFSPIDNLESRKTDVPLSANQGRVLNEENHYCGEGGTYMGVDNNGDIVKTTFVPSTRKTHVSTKEVVKAHDDVLEVLNGNSIVEMGTITHHINTGTYDRECLYKKDNVVYLSCRLHTTSVNGYNTIWASLPEGFKPKFDVFLSGYGVFNGARVPINMFISKAGNVFQSYGAVEFTELCVSGSFASEGASLFIVV